MNHSVEVSVYSYASEDEELLEQQLEVTFDINKNSYEITGYLIDGKKVDHETLLESNPGLERNINYEIDHYVANYEEDDYNPEDEPDFFDCE